MKSSILIVIGTRPEALKLIPVYLAMKSSQDFSVKICMTGQHRELLDGTLTYFDIRADFNLDVMGTSINEVASKTLLGLESILKENEIDAVMVQGDTTTAFAASLAAFYNKKKVIHVEAGLRTHNLHSPWPEEVNRQLISRFTDIHLCPTDFAKVSLLSENPLSKKIYVTGNTIIDTMKIVDSRLDEVVMSKYFLEKEKISVKDPYILMTCHRRENFGEGMQHIFDAIKIIVKQTKLKVVFPVHMNPSVRDLAFRELAGIEGVHLISPQSYENFLFLMKKCQIILTDSGGIQEEGLSYGKVILVMRDNTERPEGLSTGLVKLVGTNIETIVDEIRKNIGSYPSVGVSNPYGDGFAAQRIVGILKKEVL